MADWPGLQPDVAARWRAFDHPRRLSKSKAVRKTKTLPNSAKVESPGNLTQAVRKVAAELRKGTYEAPPPSTVIVGRRNVLARGEHRSRPNFHLLAQALRYVPNGRVSFVGAVLRAARNGDTDAKAWMQVYDGLLESQQVNVDYDDICEACGVPPDRLMAIVVSTVMRAGSDIADFVSAVYHPEIVRQTAKSAMRIGGSYAKIAQRDREMFLEHTKFIQGPKGTVVNVAASAAANAAAQTEPSVPTFAQSVLNARRVQVDVQQAVIDALPVAQEE